MICHYIYYNFIIVTLSARCKFTATRYFTLTCCQYSTVPQKHISCSKYRYRFLIEANIDNPSRILALLRGGGREARELGAPLSQQARVSSVSWAISRVTRSSRITSHARPSFPEDVASRDAPRTGRRVPAAEREESRSFRYC